VTGSGVPKLNAFEEESGPQWTEKLRIEATPGVCVCAKKTGVCVRVCVACLRAYLLFGNEHRLRAQMYSVCVREVLDIVCVFSRCVW
jgi:hypothetical protein